MPAAPDGTPASADLWRMPSWLASTASPWFFDTGVDRQDRWFTEVFILG